MNQRETFDEFWTEIGHSQLFAGQHRNEASSGGVSIARKARLLVPEANDRDLLPDAWRRMTCSLTASGFLYSGARKGEALRHFMREVRQTYPNPFHWAPFFIVGKV